MEVADASEQPACVVYPVGHPLSGHCMATEPGALFAFLPFGSEHDGDMVLPAEFAAALAASPPMPRGEQVAASDLCILERVRPAGGKAEGEPAMYRSLCHGHVMPFELDAEALQRSGVLMALTAVAAAQGVVEGPVVDVGGSALCRREDLLTADLITGRLRCAPRVRDPCHHTLSAVLRTGAEDEGEAAAPQFMCRPSNAPLPLASPCPEGTWLTAAAPREGAAGSSPMLYECVNPCVDGKVPRADGTGSYACV